MRILGAPSIGQRGRNPAGECGVEEEVGGRVPENWGTPERVRFKRSVISSLWKMELGVSKETPRRA